MKDVCDCAVARQREALGAWFKVNVKSHESIDEYAALAEVECQR